MFETLEDLRRWRTVVEGSSEFTRVRQTMGTLTARFERIVYEVESH